MHSCKTVEANIKKAVKQTKKRIKQAEEAYEAATKRLEEVSGLTSEDAKQMLIERINHGHFTKHAISISLGVTPKVSSSTFFLVFFIVAIKIDDFLSKKIPKEGTTFGLIRNY